MKKNLLFTLVALLASVVAYGQKSAGNPIVEGDYADPEGVVFGKTYWVYPTYSDRYENQLHFDCFSSKDLVKWTKHERIIDQSSISWLRMALWAPAAVEKDGKYYLFFGGNDVHQGEIGGIGVAVADADKRLVNIFAHNAGGAHQSAVRGAFFALFHYIASHNKISP